MTLAVLDNGEVLAKLVANKYRRDLEAAGIGDGRHGFSWTVPGGLSPLKRHVIQVLGEADGCELPSSPAVIAASGGFDSELQSAIRSAIEGMAAPAERAGALHFLADQMERLLQQKADGEAVREGRLIRQQLVRRWGRFALGEHSAQSPALAGAAQRRALVIDDVVPRVERDAGSNAILSHMRALHSLGYDVSFASAAGMSGDESESAALEARGIHHCRLPWGVRSTASTWSTSTAPRMQPSTWRWRASMAAGHGSSTVWPTCISCVWRARRKSRDNRD